MVTAYTRPTYPTFPTFQTLQARVHRAYEASSPESYPAWEKLNDATAERYTAFARELMNQTPHVENAFPKIALREVQPGDTVHVIVEIGGVHKTYTFTVGRVELGNFKTASRIYPEGGQVAVVNRPSQDRFDVYLIHRPAPELTPGMVLKDVEHKGNRYPMAVVRENGGVAVITAMGYMLAMSVDASDLDSYTIAQVVAK